MGEELLAEGERSVHEPRRAPARRRQPSARRYAHHGRTTQNAGTQGRTHCRPQIGLRKKKEEGRLTSLTSTLLMIVMIMMIMMIVSVCTCSLFALVIHT